MSTLAEIFGWTTNLVTNKELPSIFPLPVPQNEFISTDVTTIYSKILTDVLERTHGLKEELVPLLWDNCVKSNKSDGLVTLIAKAMADKADLYLVWESAVGVVRTATTAEQEKIRADYEKSAKSSTGVYLTFKNFRKSDMVKLYSSLEYSTIMALNRTMNVSAAVQLKFAKLREAVGLVDSAKVESQGQEIADALADQRPIMMDAGDSVETTTPDLTAIEKSISFVAAKHAFYLGMPASYITGEQTGGIGSTGEADMRAVERGLKSYYFSVVKPVLEAIFGAKTSYKSQDTRNIQSGIDVLKIFAMVDEEILSLENKTKIINKIFDLPENAKGDPAKKPDPALVPPVAGPNPPPRAVPSA